MGAHSRHQDARLPAGQHHTCHVQGGCVTTVPAASRRLRPSVLSMLRDRAGPGEFCAVCHPAHPGAVRPWPCPLGWGESLTACSVLHVLQRGPGLVKVLLHAASALGCPEHCGAGSLAAGGAGLAVCLTFPRLVHQTPEHATQMSQRTVSHVIWQLEAWLASFCCLTAGGPQPPAYKDVT